MLPGKDLRLTGTGYCTQNDIQNPPPRQETFTILGSWSIFTGVFRKDRGEIRNEMRYPPPGARAAGGAKTRKPPPKRGLSLERRLRKGLQRVVAVAKPEQREEKGPRRALFPWFFTYGAASTSGLAGSTIVKTLPIMSIIVFGGVGSV